MPGLASAVHGLGHFLEDAEELWAGTEEGTLASPTFIETDSNGEEH